MKTTKTLLFTALMIVALLAAGCKSRDAIERPRWQEIPFKMEDTIIISTEKFDFPITGGRTHVKIISSDNWALSGESDWCKASHTGGISRTSIRFSAKENTSLEDRQASFIFTCGKSTQTIKLRQLARDTLAVDKTSIETSHLEGVAELIITANHGTISYDFGYQGEEKWLDIQNIRSIGPMTYSLTLSVKSNQFSKQRTCWVNIKNRTRSKSVLIMQAANPDKASSGLGR